MRIEIFSRNAYVAIVLLENSFKKITQGQVADQSAREIVDKMLLAFYIYIDRRMNMNYFFIASYLKSKQILVRSY